MNFHNISSSKGISNPSQIYPWKVELFEIFVLGVLYFGLIIPLILTKRPWVDEGWFANPAYSFVNHGHWGTTILEEAGTSWLNIQKKTLWNPPGFFVSTSIWSKLFGFGILSLRFHSLMWGFLCVLSFYLLLKRLCRYSPLKPFLSTLFLVTGYFFANSAAEIRMETPMIALSFLSLLSVLTFEERLHLGIPLGFFLAGLSVLFHPHGVLSLLVLSLFVFIYFRNQLKWTYFLSVIPIGLTLIGFWIAYIHPDYESFLSQFRANAQGRFGNYTFLQGVLNEIQWRYLNNFGFTPGSPPIAKMKIFILLFYGACFAWATYQVLKRPTRASRNLLFFLSSFALMSVFLTVFQPNKAQYYLNSNLPFLYALIGPFYIQIAASAPRRGLFFVSFILALQGLSVLKVIRKNEFTKQYSAACDLIKNYKPNLVFASSEFGFCLGWEGQVIDDSSLGQFSGREAEVIVIDERYESQYPQYARNDHQFLVSPKGRRYEPTGHFDQYWVYKANQ